MTEGPHQPESPYSNVNKAVSRSLTGQDYVRGLRGMGGKGRLAKADQIWPEAGYVTLKLQISERVKGF